MADVSGVAASRSRPAPRCGRGSGVALEGTARLRHIGRGFVLVAALLLPRTSVAQHVPSHPLQVADLLGLEQLGPVATSPDGEWLAVVIVRPMSQSETYHDSPFGEDRSDVWLVARRDGSRRNITNGISDASGYWNPVWSPDGTRLALLSTKGGADVHLYVYDLASGTLRQVMDRAADYLRAVGDSPWPAYGMIWQNDSTLICPVRATNAPPSYYVTRLRSYKAAQREWEKAEKGVESTANVLESGHSTADSARPQGALVAVNVISATTRVLTEGTIRRLFLSPNRRYLAMIIETGRALPRADRRIPYGNRLYGLLRTRLAILALEGKATIVSPSNVLDPELRWADTPHSWSPDGQSFAVVSKADVDDEIPTTLMVVSAATGTARAIRSNDLDVTATTWSTGGDLLALARPRVGGSRTPDAGRLDWWMIDQQPRHNHRKLTAVFTAAPATLLPTPDPHTVVGIASGRLWSFSVRSDSVRDAITDFDGVMTSVAWRADGRGGNPLDFVVGSADGNLYRVSWTGHTHARAQRFPRPSPGATLATFDPDHELAVFAAAASNGAFLWTGDGVSAHFVRQLALNEQLAQIEDSKRLLLTYQGVDGDTLKAIVILPVGYQSGKRYPLVVSVYAGFVVTDTMLPSSPLFEKYFISSENVHLLPAHGYALLIPSMPLAADGQASDPWIDLPKGVMAAVDQAIAAGIADPARLGVMGHSYGGYSAYALVTYTHRFKAAVASAGLANLVSLYGSFFVPLRYDSYAHEDLFQAALSESGQTRMGAPPWQDLWRYLRNSPIYYVDRVETPLMIIQGDMDFVPMQQGEEFFTALYRQGKEATFVRYWGEAHVISSPANIRDLWRRLYAWFDRHLGETKSPSQATMAGTVDQR